MRLKPIQHWANSRWSRENLDGKAVEFRVLANGKLVSGNGKFLVFQRSDGAISVCIEVNEMGKDWTERKVTRLFLPPDAVEAIEQKEIDSEFAFRCFYKS